MIIYAKIALASLKTTKNFVFIQEDSKKVASLYIGIILLTRVAQQICSKYKSMLFPKSIYGVAKLMAFTNLLSAIPSVILMLLGGSMAINLNTVITSALSGISIVVSSICGLVSMKSGTMVLSSMFGTAGLIVPCIAGVFLFAEPMSRLQWLGIVVLIASSLLLISSAKQINPQFSFKTVFCLLGSFLANGLTMLMQMIFSRSSEGGSVSMFSFFTFAIPCLAMVLLSVVLHRQPPADNEKLPKKQLLFAAGAGVAVFIVNQLATLASGFVPPAILFAFINGGNTMIAALVAAILFGEKLTVKSVTGLLLGVASLIIIKAF